MSATTQVARRSDLDLVRALVDKNNSETLDPWKEDVVSRLHRSVIDGSRPLEPKDRALARRILET